jgi:hypothetical protein
MTSAALISAALLAQLTQGTPATVVPPLRSPPASLRPEVLHYVVNWPSGLSLGDAQLSWTHLPSGGMRLEFQLDVALPGFTIAERASSSATSAFCSIELDKEATRGKRHITERSRFDANSGTVIRKTSNGGESVLPATGCAKDALTFIAFVRHELAQGRLPAATTAWFGAPYEIRTQYGGAQRIRVGDEYADTDRLQFSLKGPVAKAQFEIFFARSPARTPVLIRVPLDAGTFSMELTR